MVHVPPTCDLTPLPMFPLGTVLFPGTALPLHVFEPRYRKLMEDCLEGSRELGIVLIERGHEVGGGDERFGVGTRAEIAEWTRLADGRYVLLAVGRRPIAIEAWVPGRPYPAAMVRDRADPEPGPEDGASLLRAEQAVRRALALAAELGADTAPFPSLCPEPVAAGWQLCAISPLGPLDRQRLLEAPSFRERLTLLTDLSRSAGDLLADRLAGG